jgi:cytosine deaminase
MTDWSRVASHAGNSFQVFGARVPKGLLQLQGEIVEVDAEGLATVNLRIVDGIVAEVTQRPLPPDIPALALDGGQVWPALVDVHTHLDKGHIWPRAENPDGTHAAASAAVGADRKVNWHADDVRQRFEFALRCAFAHGTGAIRTHIDSHEPHQVDISWQVYRELREAWSGRITLQAVLMLMMEGYARPDIGKTVRMVADSGGLLGGVTRIREPLGLQVDEMVYCLDKLFALATEYGLDIDLHVDETLDPSAMTLRQVAEAAIRHNFKGKVTCGHCCNLSTQPEEVFRATIKLCREAGIAIVTLPMCNLYLQDRAAARTPRMRGVAPAHELAAAGITVAAASDNCRDPFYAFGDHDLIEVYREFVRIAHLDMPFGDWARSVTATPAAIMGLATGVIRKAAPADLVLFRARSTNELLSRPQADRVVIRNGRAIDTALPDYRELDALFAARRSAA